MPTSKKSLRSPSHRAIYPGTFDPITNGHIDIIRRGLNLFDHIVVVIAHSGKKSPVFEPEERKRLIEECFKGETRVSVDVDEGLLAEYARKNKIGAVLRGLRGVSDFDYEFQMATMNQRMYPELQTVFLMASEQFFFVNSTLVKEVISHQGDVSQLVPKHVHKRLRERLCSK